MMSTRRDLYLLMLTYSNHKDHLDSIDLTRFLEVEQKVCRSRVEAYAGRLLSREAHRRTHAC